MKWTGKTASKKLILFALLILLILTHTINCNKKTIQTLLS